MKLSLAVVACAALIAGLLPGAALASTDGAYGAVRVDPVAGTCIIAPGAESANLASCTYNSVGSVSVFFSLSFNPAPECVGAPNGGNTGVVIVTGRNATEVIFGVHDLSGALQNFPFDFSCN